MMNMRREVSLQAFGQTWEFNITALRVLESENGKTINRSMDFSVNGESYTLVKNIVKEDSLNISYFMYDYNGNVVHSHAVGNEKTQRIVDTAAKALIIVSRYVSTVNVNTK